ASLAFPPVTIRAWSDCAGTREPTKAMLAPFIKVPIPPGLMEAFLDDFVKAPRIALEQTLNMVAKGSFLDRIKTLRVPTLVIGAAEDPLISASYLEQYVVS